MGGTFGGHGHRMDSPRAGWMRIDLPPVVIVSNDGRDSVRNNVRDNLRVNVRNGRTSTGRRSTVSRRCRAAATFSAERSSVEYPATRTTTE